MKIILSDGTGTSVFDDPYIKKYAEKNNLQLIGTFENDDEIAFVRKGEREIFENVFSVWYDKILEDIK